MTQTIATPAVDLNDLRRAIQDEYTLGATKPEHGFRFLVGRPLARLVGYDESWLEGIPEPTIASFTGTRNPFSVGDCDLESGSATSAAAEASTAWSRPGWSVRRAASSA